MCYSAQVQADYKKYVVMFGATMSIRDFYEIFYRRGLDPKIKIPKAVEASFGDPQSDDERAIKALIDDFNDKQATKFEEELFKQRKRLADAERILQTVPGQVVHSVGGGQCECGPTELPGTARSGGVVDKQVPVAEAVPVQEVRGRQAGLSAADDQHIDMVRTFAAHPHLCTGPDATGHARHPSR